MNKVKITDNRHPVAVQVDANNALLVTGINDLINTLNHVGAHGDTAIKMKDTKTGKVFAVSILDESEYK